MTALEKYIQTYFGIPNDDLLKISAFFRPISLQKGEYFLKTDRMSDKLGFVQTGIVREFIYADGKEVTKWISTEGYFTVDLASFIFQQPARFNIQALTNCELYVISKSDYQQIGQFVPRWHELEKLFLARCFSILEARIMTHLSMTAEERYKQLFEFNPTLFNQVPLQYLASMLGMTPETFSRIRKKTMHSNS
jgi:CRP/FNR family transcriptional regulator, anaerobic regulatory protein